MMPSHLKIRHSREGGNPFFAFLNLQERDCFHIMYLLDSRLRGNDGWVIQE